MPTNREMLPEHASVDDVLKAFQQSKKFAELPTHDARTSALNAVREQYRAAHVSRAVGERVGPKMDASATPTTSPTPNAPASPEIHSGSMGPTEPPTDTTGKIRNAVVGGLHGMPDPLPEQVARAVLPRDNAQAFIDMFTLGSMATGDPLPAIYRMGGAIGAGALGGSIEGGFEGGKWGALKGGAEQLGGEVIGLGLRGVDKLRGMFKTGLSDEAMKIKTKEDLGGISNWLKGHFSPKQATIKDANDFVSKFRHKSIEDEAIADLDTVSKEVREQLGRAQNKSAKASMAPEAPTPATVFSPKAQDAAQDEALASVQPKTVFSPKPESAPKVSQTQLKNTQSALDNAIAKGHPTDEINRLRTRLNELKAQTRAGASPLENAKAALADAQAKEQGSRVITNLQERVQELETQARPQKIIIPKPGADPIVAVPRGAQIPIEQIPDSVVENMLNKGKGGGGFVARDFHGKGISMPLDEAINGMHELEDAGWDMSGSITNSQKGDAARKGAIQIEESIKDHIAEHDHNLADKWGEARAQVRLSKVLSRVFGHPSVISNGAFDREALHKVFEDARVYEDLKWAIGRDETDKLVNTLFPAGPSVSDVAGQPGGVSMGGHLGHTPYFRPHMPVPEKRAGVVPYYLGKDRALAALAVLGPPRFLQMMGDVVDWHNLPANKPSEPDESLAQ